MLEKGRKRQERPVAVVYFLIGLVVLLGIIAILYFALVEVDYSDEISDPSTTVRAYVQATAVPEAVVTATPTPMVTEVPAMLTDNGDQTNETNIEATEEPQTKATVAAGLDITATEILGTEETSTEAGEDWTDVNADAQAADATLAPTALPTAIPTEQPTAIPAAETGEETTDETILDSTVESGEKTSEDLIAQPLDKKISLPKSASQAGKIGITQCLLPGGDENSVMYLAGYGYINKSGFNGEKAKSYLVVTQKSSSKKKAYKLTLTEGCSGLSHADAKCKNATACDFECYIDVSDYDQDIYSLSLVIAYKVSGETKYFYYPFDESLTFTVISGKVVSAVPASLTE